jgi:uncharacterized membrane protein YjgN (DUF898 family)
MSLKLKTVTKKESELQLSMPILSQSLESTTKKTDITTKLTLEVFVIVASIAIVTVTCYATYGLASPFADSNSDQYLQCRSEVLEKARIGEVRGAEQVVLAFAKCK